MCFLSCSYLALGAQSKLTSSEVIIPSSTGEMPKRKHQGGSNQRLAQLKAAEKKPVKSKLADELMSLWSWGTMSAPLVQSLAQAACEDGLSHPQILKMAKIGGAGQYPGNMQRDLLAMSGEFSSLQTALTSTPIRLVKKGHLSDEFKLTFLLPHKLFSFLFNSMAPAFDSSILGGDASNVPKFWAAMVDHPFLTSRPDLQTRPDLGKVVPIALHGDGVAYMQTRRAGGKSMDALSWSSLLTKGPTKSNSFLIFLVVKNMVKEWGMSQTWPRVWKVLCWSLEALATGRWPMKDWDNQDFTEGTVDDEKKGTPLAGGFAAILFVLRADLEFLAVHFKLNHPASNNPCALCLADRDMKSRPWTDCRPSAEWRKTCWGAEDWAAQHPYRHPLFKMAGAGLDLIFPDLMHTKHLGTDQVLLGSVLTWMLKHYLRGSE